MKCSPWYKGKFLLIGDAAKTMNIFIGQGFNGGMEECVLIDDLIDEFDGNWPKICVKFQLLKKDVSDKMSDFADAQLELVVRKYFD